LRVTARWGGLKGRSNVSWPTLIGILPSQVTQLLAVGLLGPLASPSWLSPFNALLLAYFMPFTKSLKELDFAITQPVDYVSGLTSTAPTHSQT
jgi:hypothetical protein